MTEPTAEEIREMAEWAGVPPYSAEQTYQNHSGMLRPNSRLLAWNDGRLLWAMQTKLREHGPVEYGYEVLYDGDWHHGADDAERLWAACREVRK